MASACPDAHNRSTVTVTVTDDGPRTTVHGRRSTDTTTHTDARFQTTSAVSASVVNEANAQKAVLRHSSPWPCPWQRSTSAARKDGRAACLRPMTVRHESCPVTVGREPCSVTVTVTVTVTVPVARHPWPCPWNGG